MNRLRLLWFATADMPSDEGLKAQCRQYAAEDEVTPEGQEKYVLQCVLNLKEGYPPA